MRNFALLALMIALLSLTAWAAWFFLRSAPPSVINLTLEPPTSTCPGGTVRFGAVVLETESWTLRERSSVGARDRAIGESTAARTGVLVPTSVCPPSRLCLEVEGRGGTQEACLAVPLRDAEWLDRLVFEPACPAMTYPPLRIAELEPEGHRTILAARNTSPDTITLSHRIDDGPPVEERVGPGEIYSLFTGHSLHGRWSIIREATPDPGVREECRPADLPPTDSTPPPGVVWLSPIEIQVSLSCANSSTGCP